MPERIIQNKVFEALARVGWLAKSVVFGMIGFLALRTAAGETSEDADIQGAIATIADEPFGGVLLWILVVGLMGYGLWRLSECIFDTEDAGADLAGVLRRGSFAVIGVFYGFLSVWLASSLVAGDERPNDGEDFSLWAARLLETPAGPWILGLVAAGTAVAGVFQIYRAVRAPYEGHFAEEQMTWFSDRIGRWIGRVGVASRGVAFGAIAYFLGRSAIEEQPEEARDLGETLLALADAPALLIIIGIGFLAYAFHCLQNARYRTIGSSDEV